MSLTAGYAYVDARLTKDFSIPTGNPILGFRDLTGESGEKLPGVSEHTFTASLDWYTSDLIGSGIDGVFNINMSYRGKSNPALRRGGTTQVVAEDDFTIVNASYSLESGPWRATLFVDNVFEERGVVTTKNSSWSRDALNQFAFEPVSRPRSIGLKVNYAFGEGNGRF